MEIFFVFRGMCIIVSCWLNLWKKRETRFSHGGLIRRGSILLYTPHTFGVACSSVCHQDVNSQWPSLWQKCKMNKKPSISLFCISLSRRAYACFPYRQYINFFKFRFSYEHCLLYVDVCGSNFIHVSAFLVLGRTLI